MIKYLESAFIDPLFLRVVMVLWAIPFLGGAFYVGPDLSEIEPDYWLLVFPIGFGLLGLWLLYTAVRADDSTVDKRTEYLSEGNQLIGLVFVVVVLILAIPIWELLKLRASD